MSIAYSTGSPVTLIPAVTCTTSKTWYNASESSTYSTNDFGTYIVDGLSTNYGIMSEDSF